MLLALATSGCVEMMLIGKGLQNAGPDQNVTELHRAAKRGDVDAVRRLIDSGANPSAKTRFGYTPLFMAVQSRQVGTVQYLLDRGVEPVNGNMYFVDTVQGPLIRHAISANSAEIFRILVQHGARLNKPLMEHALRKRADIIESAPFWSARDALNENLQIVRMLLDAGLPFPDEDTKEYGYPKFSAASSVFWDDRDLQHLRLNFWRANVREINTIVY